MLATANQQKTLLANAPITISATSKSAGRQKSNKSPETAKPREIDLLASVVNQIMRKNLPENNVGVRYARSKTKSGIMLADFSGLMPCQKCNDIYPLDVIERGSGCCQKCIKND